MEIKQIQVDGDSGLIITVVTAAEGKTLRRISDGEMIGGEIYLGLRYRDINGNILDKPYLEKPEDFEEIDEPVEEPTEDLEEEETL